MSKLNDLVIGAKCRIQKFFESERGDTNFVSMLIIIGIVVVLAGLFLTFGKGLIKTITDKVNKLIKGM